MEDGFVWPDRTELLGRCRRLQDAMREDGAGGALIMQNADLIYFCGTTQAEAVFIPADGDPLVMASMPIERTSAETSLARVEPMPKWSGLRAVLEDHNRAALTSIGLELDVLPVGFFRLMTDSALSGLNPVDLSARIREIRAVKSEYEIVQMRTAAARLDAVFRVVPGIVARGAAETELDGLLFAEAKRLGHQGFIRARGFNREMSIGHVLSGQSGLIQAKVASPTGGTGVNPGFGQGAGLRRIGPGELVSVDICGTYGGYIVDQARLFFTGPVPEIVHRTYESLCGVIDEVKAFIRPGVLSGRVYDRTFAAAEARGLSERFMNLGGVPCPFVGHGLGIELDEWPALARGTEIPLQAGMTFAFEPRVFLPEIGVVGLEDTYLLTDDGPEPLTVTDREIVVVDME